MILQGQSGDKESYTALSRSRSFSSVKDSAGSNAAVCLTPAGHYSTPRSVSCRVVYFTACATIVLLFLAYSDSFIMHLTVRRFDLPFVDFRGLVEDGRYQVGTTRGSYRTSYFKVQQHCCVHFVIWRHKPIPSNENCSLICNKIPPLNLMDAIPLCSNIGVYLFTSITKQ